MTTQTLTLTDFLLARIAEDEERAESWRMAGVTVNRVLAECEAKRRIVEACAAADAALGDAVLRLAALPYADHPSFREEWRP